MAKNRQSAKRATSGKRAAGSNAKAVSGRVDVVRVPKPWGHETIWARSERYVGKILHVRGGEALSLQYHRIKEETILVLSGALDLEVGTEGEGRRTVRLGPGDGWHLPAGTRHRMTARDG